MHDRGDVFQPSRLWLPQVALDDLEPIVGRERIAKPEGVEKTDSLAEGEELAHEHDADVFRASGHQNHSLPLLVTCINIGCPDKPDALDWPIQGTSGNLALLTAQGIDRAYAALARDHGVLLFEVAFELGMGGQPRQCRAWHQQEFRPAVVQLRELGDRLRSAHVSVVRDDARGRAWEGLGGTIA